MYAPEGGGAAVRKRYCPSSLEFSAEFRCQGLHFASRRRCVPRGDFAADEGFSEIAASLTPKLHARPDQDMSSRVTLLIANKCMTHPDADSGQFGGLPRWLPRRAAAKSAQPRSALRSSTAGYGSAKSAIVGKDFR